MIEIFVDRSRCVKKNYVCIFCSIYSISTYTWLLLQAVHVVVCFSTRYSSLPLYSLIAEKLHRANNNKNRSKEDDHLIEISWNVEFLSSYFLKRKMSEARDFEVCVKKVELNVCQCLKYIWSDVGYFYMVKLLTL